MTADAPREPLRVTPGDVVCLNVGSWPIAPGQSVWASYGVERRDAESERRVARGRWLRNDANNSYWQIDLGRFQRGDRVSYTILGESEPGSVVALPPRAFVVGPRAYLALLWHQHQPTYSDPEHPGPKGRLCQPWVRLHALRDYYSMAAIVGRFPAVHLTINLTPSLLRQIDAYTRHGVTDRALELTLKPAERLTPAERGAIVTTFFDASWHHQILPHPRYAELFQMRAEGRELDTGDLRDLQMWSSLAWFHPEFLEREVQLSTGETVSVQRFADQACGFSQADIEEMVADQYKLLRAVVPIHRALQDSGQIEITTSPLQHPILPLLIDTDRATLDRSGTRLPRRFAHPEDADAQLAHAAVDYTARFGRAPRGMWPPEGAVSRDCVPLFAARGVHWIASDQGVLERSGKWGYDARDPDVECRAYRLEEQGAELAIFFRDHGLSDMIGFSLQHVDPERAAHDLLVAIREGFVRRFASDEARVITIIVDGENPWGSYVRAGQPFLEQLYALLSRDTEIETVTFSQYLDQHPLASQERLHDLFTGSWIDELGSHSGVDLGTWIGEEEENVAWELLGDARDALTRSGASPASHPDAYESIWVAEGSDWFWWFGSDQDSGRDDEFDALFRAHLRHVWRSLELEPPAALSERFVSAAVTWTFADKTRRAAPGDRIVVRTNCPGVIAWRFDGQGEQSAELAATGGVMAGPQRYQHVIGPLPAQADELFFTVRCTNVDCDRTHPACRGEEQRVGIQRGIRRQPEVS